MEIRLTAVRRILAVVLSLGVLFLVGCSDDDAASTDATSSELPAGIDSDDDATETTTAADDVALPDACGLVDEADIEALIGPAGNELEVGETLDGLAFSQCVWENDTRQMVGVALTTSTARFASHLENLPGEPVEGLGFQAITVGGVSLETTGATGGRTISISDGDRTVVVALRLEGQTTLDAVRPLAESVLANLDS